MSFCPYINSLWVLHGKLMEASVHGITMGNSYVQKLMDFSYGIFMGYFYDGSQESRIR